MEGGSNMKRIVLFAILLLSAAYVIGGGARVFDKTEYAEFAITDSGDSAAVIQFQPAFAIDSFLYHDSIQYTADTSLWDTVSWLSEVETFILTPGIVDSSTNIACTVVFKGGVKKGFVLNVGDAYTTVAKICDTLTYAFNNTTTLKDSVLAQDSGTYVKLKSKYSEVTNDTNWGFIKVLAGGTGTLDTTRRTTTLAMVCDSMAANINAMDSAKYWTAANVGDTVYTLTSDDKGLMLWATNTDTTQDTTTLQDNVTSKSTRTDTLSVIMSLVENDFRGTGVYGDIVLQPIEADTVYGIGISDSAWIWLLTGHPVDTGIVYTVLAKDSAAALPCTLHVALPHAAANDTIFHNFMKVAWAVSDTMTDTNMYIEYPISIDLTVSDGF